ncbi:hypothetical protein KA344_17900, partial [bacterium]|nr:hypothetical protein [bacterium]
PNIPPHTMPKTVTTIGEALRSGNGVDGDPPIGKRNASQETPQLARMQMMLRMISEWFILYLVFKLMLSVG